MRTLAFSSFRRAFRRCRSDIRSDTTWKNRDGAFIWQRRRRANSSPCMYECERVTTYDHDGNTGYDQQSSEGRAKSLGIDIDSAE
mmetsp:Transcript_7047/g.20750  ORF Transcript_7047/g.20750 Transcript_7047/m.20750 type:complete len:85 (+) Transcript_7047:3928-4182(+)